MERVRREALYIKIPEALMDTPIPMARMSYQPTNEEGEPVGELQYYTARQVWPKIPERNGYYVCGFAPNDFMKELQEWQQFPHFDQVEIMSLTQARAWIADNTPEEVEV